jgi:hypothetical protein
MVEYEVMILLRTPNLTDALAAIDHTVRIPAARFIEAKIEVMPD